MGLWFSGGFEHVVDGAAKRVVHFSNGVGPFAQAQVGVFEYGQQAHGR